MRFIFCTLLFCISQLYAVFSTNYSKDLESQEKQSTEIYWEQTNLDPFSELLLSWNAKRPESGKYVLFVSLKLENWTPWYQYAEWSADEQKTFSWRGNGVKFFQDTVTTTDNLKANGFRVMLAAENGATLTHFDTLHTCLTDTDEFTPNSNSMGHLQKVFLDHVPLQSQMTLDHHRHRDLCSPTSTSTVVNYLSKEAMVDPLDFAAASKDLNHNIYGNWVLNTAEAYQYLPENLLCRVERLLDFSELHTHLQQGHPVVVSVKGVIPTAPLPYNSGHLMVVVGFDPKSSKVYCIDSAYNRNEDTLAAYDLQDFLKVWGERKNLSYIFRKKDQ